MFTPIRARLALEIGGSEALTWAKGDDAAQRPAVDYLNGRQIAIAAGTNEMQRNGIGERVLGLPREPSFDTTKPFNEVLRNSRELERQGRLRSAGRRDAGGGDDDSWDPGDEHERRGRWRRPASRRRTAAVTLARRV